MNSRIEKFSDFWDNILEPLAEKCTHNGGNLWAMLCNAKTEDEKDIAFDLMSKTNRVDWTALDFIAQMIVGVNTDLINEINPLPKLKLVSTVLNDPKYYEYFFKENEQCEECVLYKQLAEQLKIGIKVL